MDPRFRITAEYMERPHARGDAWVYRIENSGLFWGLFVDEEIRFKTLFEPGSESHDDLDEIIVPLEGRYWVRVGDWSRTLTPGEMALIPRGTPHDSGIATNLVGTHFLVLLFDPALNVLSEAGGVKLPSGATAWLRGAFRFLRQTCTSESFLALSSLPQFIAACARSQPRLEKDSTHADPIVTQLTKLLEQPRTPNLDELAHAVGLSPTHLQKRFRGALGFSPLQYANAWKLDAIAHELRSGNTLPLIDLAAEYGFGDSKHFRTLFQRRFGVGPSAYRKNPPSSL